MYLEAMEAHQEASNPEATKGEIKTDMSRLKRFHRAQKKNGAG